MNVESKMPTSKPYTTRGHHVKSQREPQLAAAPYQLDTLTGFETKRGFLAHVRDLIDAQYRTAFSLVVVDVDRFSAYNSCFGTAAGDELLIALAGTIKRLLSSNSAAARLYADRFALFTPSVGFDEERFLVGLSNVCRRTCGGTHLGVYKTVDRALPAEKMLECANLALHESKSEARGRRLGYYAETMLDRALAFHGIVPAFDDALRDGAIVPRFQPILSCKSGQVVGAEILARWNHPVFGPLDPSGFIPALEEAGLVADLDYHMAAQALSSMRSWIDRGVRMVPVSVNLSRAVLFDPDLEERLVDLLHSFELPPCMLRLEVSEHAWDTDFDQLKGALAHLQAAGFSIAVDDFGAGSTSFNALISALGDVVKLDMSFLRSEVCEYGKIVIDSMVRLMHELGFTVVVEGVESDEHDALLKGIGADLVQGYYYARPLDRAAFEEYLGGGGGFDCPGSVPGARGVPLGAIARCKRRTNEGASPTCETE